MRVCYVYDQLELVEALNKDYRTSPVLALATGSEHRSFPTMGRQVDVAEERGTPTPTSN
jgi:hypothetical protein